MKLVTVYYQGGQFPSRPARGAWIETIEIVLAEYADPGRAPHGARGLKLGVSPGRNAGIGRAPHGARGLKRITCVVACVIVMSRPARGAWIETRIV